MNVPYSSDKRVEGELGLNSCGAQTIAERDCQVRRKRLDYTVMYIAKGRAVLYRGAKKIEVGEGEALFFPPDV